MENEKFRSASKYANESVDVDLRSPLLQGITDTLSNFHSTRFRLMKYGLSLIGNLLNHLDGLNIAHTMMAVRGPQVLAWRE